MTFFKSLVAFIVGVACQVVAGLFPDLTAILAPTGSLLLGAANMSKVLNGSLWKHSVVFGLGMLCQVAAVKAGWMVALTGGDQTAVAGARAALLAAGGLLSSAADIARIISGIRTPAGTPDSPAPAMPPKP